MNTTPSSHRKALNSTTMGNKAPSLVTLVVTYNGERHIEKLLSSIPADTRVVIVDNASTDATLDRVTSFASKLHIETVRLTTNRGYAAGINVGMEHIADSADWVLVLNQDIVINAPFEKGGWGDLAERLEAQYSPYAVIQPRILLPDGMVNVDELRMNVWGFVYPPDYATIPLPKPPTETFFFSGAAFLLNAEKYHEVGPFDESLFLYYEEIDYAFRLATKGGRVLFDPTWCVTHAYEPSTASKRKMQLIWENRKTMMRRYASPLHRILALGGLGASRETTHQLSTLDLLAGFHTRQIRQPLRSLINLFAVPMGKLLLSILVPSGKRSTT